MTISRNTGKFDNFKRGKNNYIVLQQRIQQNMIDDGKYLGSLNTYTEDVPFSSITGSNTPVP